MRIDRMQLREPPRSVADWLLDAELIARRIQQAHGDVFIRVDKEKP